MIEVGEYVRLDDGTIGKYQINKNWINVVETNDKYIGFDIEKDIIKHSFNIIDLIEEGDYVNGYIVLDIREDIKTGELHLEMPIDYTNKELGDCTIYNKDIKSIVTKEQYKSVEYIVKEEQ